MKEKICKNCIYFNNGACNSEKFKYGYGKLIDKSGDEIQIENDEAWGCICGERFGCIHFEEKSIS